LESHGNGGPEGIRIVTGKDIFDLVPRLVSDLSRSLDCCIDAASAASIINALPNMLQLKGKGVKLRCIAEITRDNLLHFKELMKYFEAYHIPSLMGTFVILDGKEYLGYATDEKGSEKLMRISIPSFVQGQKFLFDKLVENALPAKKRLLEIGKGGEAEFMETIRDPHRIKELVLHLVSSAIYEISILFSHRNLLAVAEREGILDTLDSMSRNGVRVKILVMDSNLAESSKVEFKHDRDIRLNYLQQFSPTRITTIIIDESRSLVIEITDPAKETFQEAVGMATYSNSESTVFSNTSMFETLWIQSELDKQNRIRQAYFQVFKGFKLKDEVYNRRWSFERDEKGEEK
jgi:hypothetical protein